ncbi:MAG: DUF4870 domain-containing protein [Phycisphaerae bacterium]|nr:DUF4870 domain-containing protein [Phycisphaerae bacterium]
MRDDDRDGILDHDGDHARSPEQRTWAMLGHVTAFAGFVVPFGNILGPLVIWLVKKDSMPFAADQAREALNFNITYTIAMLVSAALVLVLIGIPLLVGLTIAWLVLTIVATVKSSSGVRYRYPLTFRLVS